ncbi:GH19474 [Drosophila grimshawi]|uniref:GH19474 n=1 Tax=Drosophila grimshawi TaxID=7222 RepID=B4JGL7_DROGR|nr:GH19474 [Drosophila grimshawi]
MSPALGKTLGHRHQFHQHHHQQQKQQQQKQEQQQHPNRFQISANFWCWLSKERRTQTRART